MRVWVRLSALGAKYSVPRENPRDGLNYQRL